MSKVKRSDSSVPMAKDVRPLTWTCKLTGDWLPIPEEALEALGWTEGTEGGNLAFYQVWGLPSQSWISTNGLCPNVANGSVGKVPFDRGDIMVNHYLCELLRANG